MENSDFQKFTLAYLDQELETQFLHQYGVRNGFFIRLASYLGLFVWLTYITLAFDAYPETLTAVLISNAILDPLLIYLIYRTYFPSRMSHLQDVAAFIVLLGGVCSIILFGYVIQEPYLLVNCVTGLLCFTYYLMKVRFRRAFPISLVHIFLALFMLLFVGSHTNAEVMISVSSCLMGLFIFSAGGFLLEKTEREGFLSRKIIINQKNTIKAEKEKSEELLLNVLPASIAAKLKVHYEVAENHNEVTILFADIAEFTRLAEQMSPQNLVRLLNGLFSKFDDLTDRFGLEKIKTIGDAYMAAAGVPSHMDDHAEAILNFGIEMLKANEVFSRDNDLSLKLRIGISSGPVVAGVIGKKKFIYDIWGDTVNTAARMETYGIEDRIHVSEQSYNLLHHKYQFEKREGIHIKGKGKMDTYLLKI